MSTRFITPDWPAPSNIKSLSTTRHGGASQPPYDSFNLGTHVGDQAARVEQNRQTLLNQARLPEPPRWLNQVHGTSVISANDWLGNDDADAIDSKQLNQVCVVMTADCLPILLCNKQGHHVAAIHAGWRSLAAGIIEKTLQRFECQADDLMVWLGPAIGPQQFEVGSDVVTAFSHNSPIALDAFTQTDSSHYLADIYLLAKQKLNAHGVHAIFGGDRCTMTESSDFFSYRRDGMTGRMASMIWIEHK
jgi:YfiH family protein